MATRKLYSYVLLALHTIWIGVGSTGVDLKKSDKISVTLLVTKELQRQSDVI